MKHRLTFVTCFLLALMVTATFSFADKPAPKVLILLDDGFNTGEFWQPYYALLGAGYRVDVASPEPGVIPAGSKSREFDTTADLALDEVKPAEYFALVIPGGYSPGNLEKHDRALEISKAFMKAGKPVAAVCHGPRLLAQAGTLDGRVTTGLYKLKDELPEMWQSDAFGKYVDEAVVVDGNLTTSRFPNDVPAFSRTMLLQMEKAGGIDVADDTLARLIVIDPRAPRRLGWAVAWGGIQAQGIDTEVLRTWAIGRFMEEDPEIGEYVGIVVMPGNEHEKLGKDEAFQKMLSQAEDAGLSVWAIGDSAAGAIAAAGGSVDATLKSDIDAAPEVLSTLITATKQAASKRPKKLIARLAQPAEVVIALHPGFDDRVAAVMQTMTKATGLKVAVVAPETGFIKGLAGLPIEATHTYADPPTMSEQALVIAPGGLWPDESKHHQSRLDWLLRSYDDGATLMAFGFDSLWLGKQPRFKGKKFASSDQTVWSFGKKAGKYSRAMVEQTTDRLITAKGADALPQIVGQLLDEQSSR